MTTNDHVLTCDRAHFLGFVEVASSEGTVLFCRISVRNGWMCSLALSLAAAEPRVLLNQHNSPASLRQQCRIVFFFLVLRRFTTNRSGFYGDIVQFLFVFLTLWVVCVYKQRRRGVQTTRSPAAVWNPAGPGDPFSGTRTWSNCTFRSVGVTLSLSGQDGHSTF